MPITSLPRRRFQNAGFSLVEVLVSIVVLCIGLLGMVGLQASSLQANRESRLQASAVSLARDLAEMVRGNRNAGILATGNPYLVDSSSSPLVPGTVSYCLNVGSTCYNASATAVDNAKAVGNAQMTEWLARVTNELPGARVVVCFDGSPYDAGGLPEWDCTKSGTIMVVKIGWTRGSLDRSGAGGVNRATDTGSVPGVVLPLTAGSDLGTS